MMWLILWSNIGKNILHEKRNVSSSDQRGIIVLQSKLLGQPQIHAIDVIISMLVQ